MKKKNIQIITLVFLALFALVLLLSKSKGTIKKELRDFAIADTSLIDKIFLADKENNQILLEKKKGYWALNEHSVARKDLVDILLKTAYRIRVKEPVAKSARENIIKNLAVKSTKVEFYSNNELVKVYYVGGPTQDSYGTYMILENSSSPFIMEIPGFRGFLSTRFSTYEQEWKAQIVFNYPLSEIAEVRFQNLSEPNQSFRISHNANHFELFTYPENKAIEDFDTIQVKKYLIEFRKKNFNKYIDDVPEEWQDSIRNSEPMYIVSLKTIAGETQEIRAFLKPAWGRDDVFGDEMTNDPDNFFMEMSTGDFVYAQYFVFDPIFKSLQSFSKD
jgi:hypothetical protein